MQLIVIFLIVNNLINVISLLMDYTLDTLSTKDDHQYFYRT